MASENLPIKHTRTLHPFKSHENRTIQTHQKGMRQIPGGGLSHLGMEFDNEDPFQSSDSEADDRFYSYNTKLISNGRESVSHSEMGLNVK